VSPALWALRANGIEVIVPYTHMLDGQPRLFFMHFWTTDIQKLARWLEAALDKSKVAKQRVSNSRHEQLRAFAPRGPGLDNVASCTAQ
jgi:hypothetical protein